ncbi:MAG: type II toxin-antitoxin system VapC family toxin [Deinococcales bacterium]
MSGNRFLLDTNAIIHLLKFDQNLATNLQKASWIGISIIIEFLAFPKLDATDKAIFERFVSRIHIVGLEPKNRELLYKVIELRRLYKLKVPDAIVAATALVLKAVLVTQDDDFKKVQDLEIL